MRTAITEYSPTETALHDLRARYGGVVYDVRTRFGMEEAKLARADLRKWRLDLEAERKRIKGPALQRCQEIDTEARRITTELWALEAPIDVAIKTEAGRAAAELAAKELAETERVAKIRARIDSLDRLPLSAIGKPSSWIAELIAQVEAMTVKDADFAEFLPEALAIHGKSHRQLTEMHSLAVEAEAQRVKLVEIAEREAESRRKIEAVERESRRQIEEAERQNRLTQQARDEVARLKREIAEDEARNLRDSAEERRRIKALDKAEHDDAQTILQSFVRRFEHRREFKPIVEAIKKYFDKKEEATS